MPFAALDEGLLGDEELSMVMQNRLRVALWVWVWSLSSKIYPPNA